MAFPAPRKPQELLWILPRKEEGGRPPRIECPRDTNSSWAPDGCSTPGPGKVTGTRVSETREQQDRRGGGAAAGPRRADGPGARAPPPAPGRDSSALPPAPRAGAGWWLPTLIQHLETKALARWCCPRALVTRPRDPHSPRHRGRERSHEPLAVQVSAEEPSR